MVLVNYINVATMSLLLYSSSGRHDMIHGHNMSQWVKTTDLCSKTDYKSVIFSDGSYYHIMSVDHIMSTTGVAKINIFSDFFEFFSTFFSRFLWNERAK